MPNFGGLRPLELGQSAAKAIGDDVKKNIQTAQTQISGKSVQQTQHNSPVSRGDQGMPSDINSGDFGSFLEQNQTQQTPSPQSMQNTAAQQNAIAEKFAVQKKDDEAKLAAARRNLQELEEAIKKIRQEREQKGEQEEQVEEQQKKQEEFWKKEEEKKQPISAGQRSGEVKGNKG